VGINFTGNAALRLYNCCALSGRDEGLFSVSGRCPELVLYMPFRQYSVVLGLCPSQIY
jgi:hypothetical protein